MTNSEFRNLTPNKLLHELTDLQYKEKSIVFPSDAILHLAMVVSYDPLAQLEGCRKAVGVSQAVVAVNTMKHIDEMQIGQYAGLTHEIQRMLHTGKIDFELVKFQLSRLTQKSMQGIVGQVPTFRQVRAPGSLQPTIDRLKEKEWLDLEIPEEVIQHAVESCAEVPSGTMLDVIRIPLWMIGKRFDETKDVFKAARANRLSSDHNSWLPMAMIDQGQNDNEGNASFLLKKFGRFDRWSLTSSPGSSTRVRIDYPNHWFLYRNNSHCFVREA